ncbi:hypothetical protein [Nostoc sp.]|uniref:hypothetical protein n=1 Tax=Nostoc sp. TaxID=1180 RepID=UPI002FF5CFED
MQFTPESSIEGEQMSKVAASLFPLPHAQCPMPHAPCPMPHPLILLLDLSSQ